jgi:Hint domain/Subtilase family
MPVFLPDDTADAAVAGAAARATYSVDGAGIKVGIISDSFDADGSYAADVTDGYLPAGIQVLADNDDGTDEGRAMAELVHETAPGAAIAFCDVTDGTGIATEANFAAAVNTLAAAGCNVIVDDVSTSDEPTFQLGNGLDTAIANFIAGGGDYFTAAGNDGEDYDQTGFSGGVTTIAGLGEVTAATFAPGVYQDALTLAPGATEVDVRLSWDQPFASIGSGGASGDGSDDSLGLYLMNGSGQIVAQSVADQVGGDPYQDLDYAVPVGSDGHYSIVVALADGPAPTTFRLDLANDPGTLAFQGGEDGDLSGQSLVPGVNNVGAVDVDETPSQDVSPPVVDSFSQYGGGELLFDGNGVALPMPQATSGIAFVAPDGATTSVGRQFAPFYGTSPAAAVAAGVAALMLQADPTLTPAELTAGLEASAIPMASPDQSGAGLIQAPAAVAEALGMACFAEGTRIRTPSGDTEVEMLRVGDLVSLARGGAEAILWLGQRRVDCRRHVSPHAVWPVRIGAEAFGAGAPLRDLFLSPDHAVHAEGVLIPIKHLTNGVSVRQAGRDEIHYFHIELPRHEVILAEGLPVESYLDAGDRQVFDEGVSDAQPLFGGLRHDLPLLWDGTAAATLCVTGPLVERVRASLARRAEAMRAEVA